MFKNSIVGKRWLCLVEARRLLDKEPNKDPLTVISGVGYNTEYKTVVDERLMEWVNKPVPREVGWLILTKKGLAVMKSLNI